jgi:hypothetical protein
VSPATGIQASYLATRENGVKLRRALSNFVRFFVVLVTSTGTETSGVFAFTIVTKKDISHTLLQIEFPAPGAK